MYALDSFIIVIYTFIFWKLVSRTDSRARGGSAHSQFDWRVTPSPWQHIGGSEWPPMQFINSATPPPSCGAAHVSLHIPCCTAEWTAPYSHSSELTNSTYKTTFILLVSNSQPQNICHLLVEPGLHCDHDGKQQTDKWGSGPNLTAQQPIRASGSGTSSTKWSQSTNGSRSGDSKSDQNHSPDHGASGHDANEPGWYVTNPPNQKPSVLSTEF